MKFEPRKLQDCSIFTKKEIEEIITLSLNINTYELSKKLLISKIENKLSKKIIISGFLSESDRYLLFERYHGAHGTIRIIFDTLNTVSLDFVTNTVIIARIYLDGSMIERYINTNLDVLDLLNMYSNE